MEKAQGLLPKLATLNWLEFFCTAYGQFRPIYFVWPPIFLLVPIAYNATWGFFTSVALLVHD